MKLIEKRKIWEQATPGPYHFSRGLDDLRIHGSDHEVFAKFLIPDPLSEIDQANLQVYLDGRTHMETLVAALTGEKASVGIGGDLAGFLEWVADCHEIGLKRVSALAPALRAHAAIIRAALKSLDDPEVKP